MAYINAGNAGLMGYGLCVWCMGFSSLNSRIQQWVLLRLPGADPVYGEDGLAAHSRSFCLWRRCLL
ncbi:MAG: hypothetical protein ACOX63_00835 [Christensenellales bacterium]